MKRYNVILLILISVMVMGVSGCSTFDDVTNDAYVFKEEYESLNGMVNSSSKEYRTVSISSDNPFVYSTASEIVDKILAGESFYVYFGSKLCPWCRSVIEKAISVSIENNIDVIYYVDIWDDDGEEVLRDKYTINDDGDVELVSSGTDSYYELLSLLGDVLDEYTLTDADGEEVSVGEKRIYAPYFVYVEDGVVVKGVDGISSLQSGSRDELTDEILEDEEEIFEEFFSK